MREAYYYINMWAGYKEQIRGLISSKEQIEAEIEKEIIFYEENDVISTAKGINLVIKCIGGLDEKQEMKILFEDKPILGKKSLFQRYEKIADKIQLGINETKLQYQNYLHFVAGLLNNFADFYPYFSYQVVYAYKAELLYRLAMEVEDIVNVRVNSSEVSSIIKEKIKNRLDNGGNIRLGKNKDVDEELMTLEGETAYVSCGKNIAYAIIFLLNKNNRGILKKSNYRKILKDYGERKKEQYLDEDLNIYLKEYEDSVIAEYCVEKITEYNFSYIVFNLLEKMDYHDKENVLEKIIEKMNVIKNPYIRMYWAEVFFEAFYFVGFKKENAFEVLKLFLNDFEDFFDIIEEINQYRLDVCWEYYRKHREAMTTEFYEMHEELKKDRKFRFLSEQYHFDDYTIKRFEDCYYMANKNR